MAIVLKQSTIVRLPLMTKPYKEKKNKAENCMDQLFKDILSQDTALWNLNHVMDAGTHNIWLLQAWRFSMSFHFFFLSYSERGRTAFFCNTYLHAIYIHCSRACGVDGITNLLME
jgi:hypothetical protein